MPFNIAGDWIPSVNSSTHTNKPVKVRLIKRGKNILTVILNLNLPANQLSELASRLKKKLGCGGALKEDCIEIQGDKVDLVKKFLADNNIKT